MGAATLLAVLTLLPFTTAPGTDGLTVGTVTSGGSGIVRVPVYLKDTAATPIGSDQAAGRKITGVSFQVGFGGNGCVTTVAPYFDTAVAGGILASLSPDIVARPRAAGSQGLLFAVSEATSGGKGLPTSTATPDPGDKLGELVFSLNGCTSDVALQGDAALAALTSDSGTAEKVSLATLSVTPGAIRISGEAPPPATTVLTIPAVASVHGLNGAFFHSDLWVMNLSATTRATVTARYRCACAGGSRTFELAPRESRLFPDAVVSLFDAPETSGAIELSHDAAARVGARSRVYTPSLPAPTNGAGVPAYAPAEARTRALFLGVAGNGGDLSGGFRSNAGAYNPNDASTAVTFTLRAAGGAPLGAPLTQTWGPREARQLNDVFAAVGSAGTVTTGAYLEVRSALPLFPYLTVIDNQSGDSVWVPPLDDGNAASSGAAGAAGVTPGVRTAR